MNLIIPSHLKPSATIAFVSLAGAIEDKSSIFIAKDYFENRGYRVKFFMPDNNKGYLGGSDEERLCALHCAFSDTSVDAIIAIRGGYGSLRLINKIDWQIIKNNPKIFAGFSDITALLLMIYKKTGLLTFHSPMVCSDFGAGISPVTEKYFFETLFNGFQEAEVIGKFSVKGILWGGNLATTASLCGLDFVPDEDFVFLAEDVNEPIYKIDRMFTQLFNIEKFRKNIRAIVLGDFSSVSASCILESISFPVPVFYGLKCGHEKDKLTLPIGLPVSILNGKIIPNLSCVQ